MKDVLKSAIQEIHTLRRSNEILYAQVRVMETFRAALLGVERPQGASPDVAWQLEKLVRELETPSSHD